VDWLLHLLDWCGKGGGSPEKRGRIGQTKTNLTGASGGGSGGRELLEMKSTGADVLKGYHFLPRVQQISSILVRRTRAEGV